MLSDMQKRLNFISKVIVFVTRDFKQFSHNTLTSRVCISIYSSLSNRIFSSSDIT